MQPIKKVVSQDKQAERAINMINRDIYNKLSPPQINKNPSLVRRGVSGRSKIQKARSRILDSGLSFCFLHFDLCFVLHYFQGFHPELQSILPITIDLPGFMFPVGSLGWIS